VRFASGVLREQCLLVTILASQRACMRVVVAQACSSAARIPRCLAGRTFACKQMPLRTTNSTQVLFV